MECLLLKTVAPVLLLMNGAGATCGSRNFTAHAEWPRFFPFNGPLP